MNIDTLSIGIVNCITPLQIEEWNKAAISLSSHPQKRVPGRWIKLFVVDANNANEKLGLIRITGPNINLNANLRNFLGWNTDDVITAAKNGRLQHIACAQLVIPFQPFGYECLGGKLLTVLCSTRDVMDIYSNKYNCEIAYVYTMSMTAGLCQYSSIKKWKRLGHTANGIGVFGCALYDNYKAYLKNEIDNMGNSLHRPINEVVAEWKAKAKTRFIQHQ